jgi:ABC-type nitrate/sulfonate/bicarbonate transport system substrate-binding protein
MDHLWKLLGVCLLYFLVIAVFAPGLSWSEEIHIGYPKLGWSSTELIDKLGLLTEKGYTVKYDLFQVPSQMGVAFGAKKLQVTTMSVALAGKMHEQGIPFKITGVAQAVLGSIVVPKDSPVQSVPDLKGKKVGAVLGSSTFGDFVWMIQKTHGMDIRKDTQLISATSPPDLATLMLNGSIDAAIGWIPIPEKLVSTGNYRYLVKQQALWEQAYGRKDPAVLVVYIASDDVIQNNRQFLKDLNEAQKKATETWYADKETAIKVMQEVTELPKDLVSYSYDQTTKVLYGLTEEHIEQILFQWKEAQLNGFLKNDVWLKPEEARKLFFKP